MSDWISDRSVSAGGMDAEARRRWVHRANWLAVCEAWERHGQRDDKGSGRRLTATLLTVARAADCVPSDVDKWWVHQAMVLLTGHVGTLTPALVDRPLLADRQELLWEIATLGDCEPWCEWAAARVGELLASDVAR